MIITVLGSLNFTEKMREVKEKLEKMGHEVIIPPSMDDMGINDSDAADKLKQDRERYIKEIKPVYTKKHFDNVVKADAVLVINLEKNGIKNYIGGATFSEIMLAFHYGKKIFFLNPIPRNEKFSFIIDEIEGVGPIVINGNLELIR